MCSSDLTIALAFPRADVPHPLDAVGVIFPRSDKRRILAATFTSSKWAGRAPGDMALLRAFVGGFRGEGVLAEPDDALIELARQELGAIVGVTGKPVLGRVFRFERSNAQPVVGHLERLGAIRAAASKVPGLHVTGAAYDGVGIPDCVRQGTETAGAILTAASRAS